ncbi:unnamed protein product [Brassica rapa subsp. trilocularis]
MFIAALVLCITCTVWYFFLSGSSAVSVVTSAVVSPKRLCRAPIGSRCLGEQLRMWLSSLPVFLQLALCSEAECNKCDIGSLVASSRIALKSA